MHSPRHRIPRSFTRQCIRQASLRMYPSYASKKLLGNFRAKKMTFQGHMSKRRQYYSILCISAGSNSKWVQVAIMCLLSIAMAFIWCWFDKNRTFFTIVFGPLKIYPSFFGQNFRLKFFMLEIIWFASEMVLGKKRFGPKFVEKMRSQIAWSFFWHK